MRSRPLALSAVALAALTVGSLAGCDAQTTRAAASGTTAASGNCGSPAATGDPLAAPPLQHLQPDPQIAAQVPAAAKSAPLVIGVAPDLPPINFGKDGEQRGYEADLLRMAGQLAGVQVTFKQSQNALQDYGAGQVDGIAGAFTDTKEREKLGTFIDYSNGSRAAITQQCNPKGIHQTSDLCGKKVAAAVGTVQLAQLTDPNAPGSLLALCQKADKPAPVPVQTDTSVSAITALTAGRADALVTGEPIANNAAKQSRGNLTVAYAEEQQVPIGVLISAKHTDLVPALQKAYQKLVDDGTYATTMQAYGITVGLIKTVTVNGAQS